MARIRSRGGRARRGSGDGSTLRPAPPRRARPARTSASRSTARATSAQISASRQSSTAMHCARCSAPSSSHGATRGEAVEDRRTDLGRGALVALPAGCSLGPQAEQADRRVGIGLADEAAHAGSDRFGAAGRGGARAGRPRASPGTRSGRSRRSAAACRSARRTQWSVSRRSSRARDPPSATGHRSRSPTAATKSAGQPSGASMPTFAGVARLDGLDDRLVVRAEPQLRHLGLPRAPPNQAERGVLRLRREVDPECAHHPGEFYRGLWRAR